MTFAETKEDNRVVDETFPSRLAAMNVYYAQRSYKQLNNDQYASTIEELIPYMDESVVDPFDLYIMTTADNTKYKVNVHRKEDSKLEASVTHDRLLLSYSEQDFAYDELK